MRTILWILLGALLGVALLPYVLFRQKPMPEGTDLSSPNFEFNQARLLIDRTVWDAGNERLVRSHVIFDAILSEIEAAETYLITDFFLWNPWRGAVEASGDLRPLAEELADALIRKRIQNPEMPMLVLTDPINRIYGDVAPEFYQRLEEARIPVVFTDLTQMPDSNRVYAPQVWFWSRYVPAPSDDSKRWIPNPFDAGGPKLTLSQLGRLLYFKANHRKVLIAGYRNQSPRAILGSLNPADGSANHSNVAARVDGAVAVYAAHSELAVAEWSSADARQVQGQLTEAATQAIASIRARLPGAGALPVARPGAPSVAWRSEGAIQDEIVQQLDQATAGTRVDAAIFYFSDRRVVDAMKGALRRGASVRVLMDANRDAFGREKNGIPNRIVAAELLDAADSGQAEVRWAATHGEQYHAKVLRVVGPSQDVLFLGSANWTRRNIGNLNLEANLLFQNAPAISGDFDQYFQTVWSNSADYEESLPYEAWAEKGWSLTWKTWLYRFQEWSGASTF